MQSRSSTLVMEEKQCDGRKEDQEESLGIEKTGRARTESNLG
jgi:hypothetical protein